MLKQIVEHFSADFNPDEKMKIVALVLLTTAVVCSAQFPNGRVLEPPNPQLCAKRVIHERAPDGKGYLSFN